MAPEIRYARTADGVSIAYFAVGSGPLLLDHPAPPFGHTEMIWRIREFREQFEAITQRITYCQYDPRGFGMSDRDITDFSLDAMTLDLEAVADALGRDRFAIATFEKQGMCALRYAAAHGDRVIAMVLREGVGRPHAPDPWFHGLRELARNDWPLFTRSLADHTQNLRSVTGLRQMQELMSRTATQETYLRYAAQSNAWDVSDILSEVDVPVLVTNNGSAHRDECRWLVANLPRGSLVTNDPPRGERSPSEDAFVEFIAKAFASEGAGAPAASETASRASDALADDSSSDGARLTVREVEVLRLIVAGKSSREIAEELVLSVRTVERHVANIYRKTDTHGRAQLATFAVRRNLA
jgi:DNA-binding CsgD family transcriptional regulator